MMHYIDHSINQESSHLRSSDNTNVSNDNSFHDESAAEATKQYQWVENSIISSVYDPVADIAPQESYASPASFEIMSSVD